MTTGVRGKTAPDLLEAIVAATRREVGLRQQRLSRADVERAAAEVTPGAESFLAALRVPDRFNVIAECKRRSPSRGVLRADYRADLLATEYAAAGAAAVSVLTEPAFFDGALGDLAIVRAAVGLPLLRKDFVVSEYQLIEARAAGADAVLLIATALDDRTLKGLIEAADSYGLAVLVEVHDTAELSVALEAGAAVIGVNNRNLRTLEVNREASEKLIAELPERTIAVAESGLRTRGDLVTLRRLGYDAFLIGEALMTQEEPGKALRALLSGAGSPRRGRRAEGARSASAV